MGKSRLMFILLLLLSVGFTACCSCGGSGDENIVKGIITVVGHEPFTKIAVAINDEKIYTLKCSKELEKELWQKQGYLYAIQFSESIIEEGLPTLVVEKATPINKKNDE